MNKFLSHIFIALVCIAPTAVFAGSVEREAAIEFMEAANFDKITNDAIETAILIVKRTNPEMGKHEDKLRIFYQKYIGPDALREDMIEIYMNTFTANELKEIAAHYRTPVGQKALVKLPELMQRGAELGQNKVSGHLDELVLMIAE